MLRKKSDRTRKKLVFEQELFFDLILIWYAIFMVFNFWRSNFFLTLALILGWLVAIRLWHKKEDILAFIVGALMGSVGEINAVAFGAWSYSNPDIFGIPFWLPLFWGYYAVLLKKVYVALDQNKRFFSLK